MNTSNLKQIQPHEIKQGDFIYYTLYDTICYILSARVGGTMQNDCRIIKQHGMAVNYEREYNFCSGDIYLIQGEELNRLKAEFL